jgi:hypothetical protein
MSDTALNLAQVLWDERLALAGKPLLFALSFLITLSAISESRRDRQVATGFEDLYFLEQAFAVFRIVRGRRTVQSP